MTSLSSEERARGCLLGAFIADALAMPVHLYLRPETLQRDHGTVTDYLAPKEPHPDSFMEEASYTAPNPRGEILHDQGKHWGRRGVHYHRDLKPGENTLNLRLAGEVWKGLQADGGYHVRPQLERYLRFMRTPGTHHDTYVDWSHRHFFLQYAGGRDPLHCGRTGEKHIGGLTVLIPILVHYRDLPEAGRIAALQHLLLTHLGEPVEQAAALFTSLLQDLLAGHNLREGMRRHIGNHPWLHHNFDALLAQPDQEVVGRVFKTSGMVEEAMPSVVYLTLKYHDRPEQALIASTNLGGDNCHRGALIGALLGAAHGSRAWPERWVRGLVTPPAE